MSVYVKLQTARLKLLGTDLKKSGHNDYAGYDYFELADFLPTIQEICDDIGLCGVVSFTKEEARLTLVDLDDPTGERIVVTSPMGSANLKGCHEIQNIGATETYQRRYLWVAAFEIVEHDIIERAERDDGESSNRVDPVFGEMSAARDLDELQDIYRKGMKASTGQKRDRLIEHYEKLKKQFV